MLKKPQTLGTLAHTMYAIIAVVVILPLIILWSKANIVGVVIVTCIVFLPILAVWIGLRKRNRNMHRPMARPKS